MWRAPAFQCIFVENSSKVDAANKEAKSVQLLNLKSDGIGLKCTRANDVLTIIRFVLVCIVYVLMMGFCTFLMMLAYQRVSYSHTLHVSALNEQCLLTQFGASGVPSQMSLHIMKRRDSGLYTLEDILQKNSNLFLERRMGLCNKVSSNSYWKGSVW